MFQDFKKCFDFFLLVLDDKIKTFRLEKTTPEKNKQIKEYA